MSRLAEAFKNISLFSVAALCTVYYSKYIFKMLSVVFTSFQMHTMSTGRGTTFNPACFSVYNFTYTNYSILSGSCFSR